MVEEYRFFKKEIRMISLLCFPFFLLLAPQCVADTSSAVSYELNGGRFGDNLRSFTQAYWECYKHDLPFLYVPFPGSEELVLHTQFKELTPEVQNSYREVRKIHEGQPLIVT